MTEGRKARSTDFLGFELQLFESAVMEHQLDRAAIAALAPGLT